MISDVFSLCEKHLKISEKINNPEEFIVLNDSILSMIEYLQSDEEDILKAKNIIKNIKLRKLYKYVGEINNFNLNINNFNSIREFISKKKPEYNFPKITNEKDIIIEKLNLSYNFNPLDHVIFYNSDNEVIKINKTEYIDTIRPINEKKTRIFCKNNIDVENLKKILTDFKQIYFS